MTRFLLPLLLISASVSAAAAQLDPRIPLSVHPIIVPQGPTVDDVQRWQAQQQQNELTRMYIEHQRLQMMELERLRRERERAAQQ